MMPCDYKVNSLIDKTALEFDIITKKWAISKMVWTVYMNQINLIDELQSVEPCKRIKQESPSSIACRCLNSNNIRNNDCCNKYLTQPKSWIWHYPPARKNSKVPFKSRKVGAFLGSNFKTSTHFQGLEMSLLEKKILQSVKMIIKNHIQHQKIERGFGKLNTGDTPPRLAENNRKSWQID